MMFPESKVQKTGLKSYYNVIPSYYDVTDSKASILSHFHNSDEDEECGILEPVKLPLPKQLMK